MPNNPGIIIRGGQIILVGNGNGGNANETADKLDIINIHPGTKLDDIIYDGTNNDQKMSYIRKGQIVICVDENRGDTVRHSCQFVFIPVGGGPPIVGTINSSVSGIITGTLADFINSQINGFINAVIFLNLEIPLPGCDQQSLPQELLVHGLSVQKKREEIIPALKYLSVEVKVI